MTDVYLKHHGVKGMKWGVRKEYSALRNRELSSVSVKTKSGSTLEVAEDRTPRPAAVIAAFVPAWRRRIARSKNLTLRVDGQKVGDASIEVRGKDNKEMYFNWLGVDQKHRGKGYASATFDAGVKLAKSQGCSNIVLEVPGNAPDARHIYEKQGFVATKVVTTAAEDLMWGGLTEMRLDVEKGRTHGRR